LEKIDIPTLVNADQQVLSISILGKGKTRVSVNNADVERRETESLQDELKGEFAITTAQISMDLAGPIQWNKQQAVDTL